MISVLAERDVALSRAQMVQVTDSGAGSAFPCTAPDQYRHDGTGVSFFGGWALSTPTRKRTTGAVATGNAVLMPVIRRQRVGVLGVPPRGRPV